MKISYRSLVEAKTYPRFTLIGQSVGSLILTAEAVLRRPPALFFDTAGYAFGYGVVTALVGCPVACYTHYPTISEDMLGRVKSRTAMYNNDAAVASRWVEILCVRIEMVGCYGIQQRCRHHTHIGCPMASYTQ